MAKRKATSEESAKPPAAEYTVLARRYRPQLFTELVGQEPVAEALVNALESGRVAHAYLFTGARGVGKTSTVRILAKCLNCVKGPTTNPCNECDSCLAITQGEDVDVIEIDGASNNKVEEVRELRSNVQYRPTRGHFKIYIIDEVHMLSTAAFNALLKTLEEPPAHVKFIFATTEVQKIPVTILSRCQRFDFAGIGTQRIVARLKQIVTSEKMQADEEALEVIARRAGGSMRDAQSLLDQLLAMGGEKLTVEQVQRLLGLASDERVGELAAAVLQGDSKTALSLVAQAAEVGMQVGEFLDQLIGYWRDLMVVRSAGLEGQTLNVRASQREILKGQAERQSLDAILAGLDILSAAKSRARQSNHPRVLEMTLVRLAHLDQLVSLAQLAQWVGQGPERNGTADSQQISRDSPCRDNAADKSGSLAAHFADAPAPGKKNTLAVSEHLTTTNGPGLTTETISHIWDKLISQIGMTLGMPLRRGGLPAIIGPKSLVICFPLAYNQERLLCQEPGNVARVEQALLALTGQSWTVRFEQDANTAPAASNGGPAPEAAGGKSRRQRTEALANPLLKRAIEVLDAQILDVPEGFGASPTQADKATSEET